MKSEAKKIEGFLCISDFNNFDTLTKDGEPIEVYQDKEDLKDATYPSRKRIVPCKITLL